MHNLLPSAQHLLKIFAAYQSVIFYGTMRLLYTLEETLHKATHCLCQIQVFENSKRKKSIQYHSKKYYVVVANSPINQRLLLYHNFLQLKIWVKPSVQILLCSSE